MTSSDADLELFAARARPLGTEVDVVTGAGAALATIHEAVGSNARVVATADAAPAFSMSALAGADDATSAEVAVSVAWAGIVETGSVVIAPRDRCERLLHVLAPTQVVIVPAARLHATLDDAFAAIDAGLCGASPPPYVSVVTGPSRTADIERVITIGAHGPRRLHLVVVREWGDG